MRRFFGLIFVFMTIMTAQAANIGQCNAYLAYHDITDIEPAGQLIYVLSSNDLFSYNVNDKSVYAYNKTNSISDTEINYIAWNPSAKKLIIIYSNYNIDLLDNNFNVEKKQFIRIGNILDVKQFDMRIPFGIELLIHIC